MNIKEILFLLFLSGVYISNSNVLSVHPKKEKLKQLEFSETDLNSFEINKINKEVKIDLQKINDFSEQKKNTKKLNENINIVEKKSIKIKQKHIDKKIKNTEHTKIIILGIIGESGNYICILEYKGKNYILKEREKIGDYIIKKISPDYLIIISDSVSYRIKYEK